MRPRSCEDCAAELLSAESLSEELLPVGLTIVGGASDVVEVDEPVGAGAVLAGLLEPEFDFFLRAQGGRSGCDCACSAATKNIANTGRQKSSARRVAERVGRMRY